MKNMLYNFSGYNENGCFPISQQKVDTNQLKLNNFEYY